MPTAAPARQATTVQPVRQAPVAPGFPDLLRPFLPRPNVLPQPNTVGAAAVGGNATVAETTAEDEATDEADSDQRDE